MSRIRREDILFFKTGQGRPAMLHKDYIISILKHPDGCEIRAVMEDDPYTCSEDYQEVLDRYLAVIDNIDNRTVCGAEPDSRRPV